MLLKNAFGKNLPTFGGKGNVEVGSGEVSCGGDGCGDVGRGEILRGDVRKCGLFEGLGGMDWVEWSG